MARFVPTATRQAYSSVRSLTEELAAPLSAEDQTVQSMPDVSPTKWHRAHTTWFFEEFVLGPHLPGYEAHHPGYRFLFNSYYEAVGPRHDRGRRGVISRPGIEEVAAYRRRVDEAMSALLGTEQSAERVGSAELVVLGLHHEQQHQELLLMDIKHVLAQNPLDPVYREIPPPPAAATGGGPAAWLEHPGGQVTVGAPVEAPEGETQGGFSFDNERPRHEVLLRPFAIADRPVTCGEWLAFVDDGGYRRPELWLSDGWAAVQAERWEAPLYWSRQGSGWCLFTLAGRRPVREAEPVCHVSHYEADAFARWAGARLPTEAEWEVLVGPAVGERCADPLRAHPSVPQVPRATGAAQGVGEVWEWTASPYVAYPGFRTPAGAVGEYNGKFMSNQQVLRGGSCATPAGHARATYRNFFPPGARWAFSGLRLAQDA
jgi:ergothioneine biosynthesis protein EgtB